MRTKMVMTCAPHSASARLIRLRPTNQIAEFEFKTWQLSNQTTWQVGKLPTANNRLPPAMPNTLQCALYFFCLTCVVSEKRLSLIFSYTHPHTHTHTDPGCRIWRPIPRPAPVPSPVQARLLAPGNSLLPGLTEIQTSFTPSAFHSCPPLPQSWFWYQPLPQGAWNGDRLPDNQRHQKPSWCNRPFTFQDHHQSTLFSREVV